MKDKKEMTASEALYMFCGWLTTKKEPTIMSSTNTCGEIAEKVEKFITYHNLSQPKNGWEKRIKHPD